MRVTYLGHAAFKVVIGGRTLLFDPWLTGNPAAPVKVEDVEEADYIFVSHDHGDHGLEDAVDISRRTGAPIVAIFEVANKASGMGAKTVDGNIGGPIKIDGLEVVITQAVHSSASGSPTGFVVKAGSETLYHAGDTGLFSGMELIGRLYQLKLALLPIGGHYTMGPREAALAASLLKPEYVVPMHYATFPVLWGTPEMFKEELMNAYPKAKLIILKPGETAEI